MEIVLFYALTSANESNQMKEWHVEKAKQNEKKK